VSSPSEAPPTAGAEPSTHTAAGEPVIRPTGRRGRGAANVGDMVRSLIFVLIAIVVLFGGFLFVDYQYHGSGNLNRVDSDLAAEVPLVRLQAPFSLLAPVGLPHAWAPTSVTWAPASTGVPAVFHVGWVTPSSKFLDLEESDGDVAPLLSPYEKSPVADGSAVVAGVTYAVSRSTDGSLTYLSHVGNRYLGVTGGATEAEIEQLLTSLH
jgi:hypothetical protein